MSDKDISIPALTVEQIATLEENQLSLDLSWADDNMVVTNGGIAGNMDFSYNPGLGVGAAASGTYTVDTIDLSGSIDWSTLGSNVTLGPVWSDTLSVNPSSKITLNGDDADIEINGESIVGMLKEIRNRLNIIQVSETMESEWDELRALREQYEAKLAECREKNRAWDALKQ